MKLEVNDIAIREGWYVRISVGGYMYFDSPHTTKENALIIYDNLVRSIE